MSQYQSWQYTMTGRDRSSSYLAARPGIDGEILSQRAAIDLGRHIFGALLGRNGA
jgi:hypothetical protein